MPLQGKGFLGLWHDISRESEPDYNSWHTQEHMPERVSLPGFRRARRGVDWALSHQRYLTVYEGDELSDFRSKEYLERLNNPSAWSARVAPAFRNFLRVACETASTVGIGAGGAMATVRADLPKAMDEATFRSAIPKLSDDLLALVGVCGVHIAFARTEFSNVKTTETKLRPQMQEPGFDIVILVEAIGRRELEALSAAMAKAVSDTGIDSSRTDIYDIAYTLSPDGGS